MYDSFIKWAMCSRNEIYISSLSYDTILFPKKQVTVFHVKNKASVIRKNDAVVREWRKRNAVEIH